MDWTLPRLLPRPEVLTDPCIEGGWSRCLRILLVQVSGRPRRQGRPAPEPCLACLPPTIHWGVHSGDAGCACDRLSHNIIRCHNEITGPTSKGVVRVSPPPPPIALTLLLSSPPQSDQSHILVKPRTLVWLRSASTNNDAPKRPSAWGGKGRKRKIGSGQSESHSIIDGVV